MPKLELKFTPENLEHPHLTGCSRGWIVCHPQESNDGKDYELSSDCVTALEVEDCAKALKRELDSIVAEARRKLPAG